MALRSLNVSAIDVRQRERYQKCLDKLTPIIERVQSDECNIEMHKKLMDDVLQVYNECGLKIFSETLFRMMIVPFQTKDSPYVKKVLEFFFAVVSDEQWEAFSSNSPNDTITSVNSNTSMIEDGSNELFPVRVLRLCERYVGESRALVRQRVLQTVMRIVPSRVSPNEIRRNLVVKLIKMLLSRTKDKSDQVRAYAVELLCVFQFQMDNMPFQTQVLDTLLVRMAYDPEPSVRAKIVSVIAVTDDTMEHVVERSGDPNANVRVAALDRITSCIKLSSLTLEMREAILQANTTDGNPKSVQKAVNKMLEKWLSAVKDDPCEFLRILSVRKRPRLCKTALDNLYNKSSEETFEKIRWSLFGDKKYPEESLCAESTYLWVYLFNRFKDDPYVYPKLALPVNEMIEYIKEYLDVIDDEGELSNADLDFRGWMLGDMIRILTMLPVEEGERQAILEFIPTLFLKKKIMNSRNCGLGVLLIAACCNDSNDRENAVSDIVNAVLNSDRQSSRKSPSTCKTPSTDSKVELGNLMHKLKKLQRDQQLAVRENDLSKAQHYQEQIEVTEAAIAKLKKDMDEETMNDSEMNDSQESEFEEPWVFSDKTILIALSIVKMNIVQHENIVSDFSRMFYDMYVQRAVTCCDPVVRALALEVMCMVAIDHEDVSAKAGSYSLTALLKDVMYVKETALKCLYDLVVRYSFAELGANPRIQNSMMGMESTNGNGRIPDGEDAASTLKTLLLSYIRHENSKLVKVSVEGVLKLLFKNEINPARIITTFLTNWAIPTYESQLRFKYVGEVIPIYASLSEKKAEVVAKCLMECMTKIRTLIHASSNHQKTDQIPPPDADKVVNLVVNCTNPSLLSKYNIQRPYMAHEIIANEAINELRSSDLTTDAKHQYAKLLKVLDLRLCSKESLTRMAHSLEDIAEQSNRSIAQILGGFRKYLESLISNDDEELAASNTGAGAWDDDDDENA